MISHTYQGTLYHKTQQTPKRFSMIQVFNQYQSLFQLFGPQLNIKNARTCFMTENALLLCTQKENENQYGRGCFFNLSKEHLLVEDTRGGISTSIDFKKGRGWLGIIDEHVELHVLARFPMSLSLVDKPIVYLLRVEPTCFR